MHDLIDPRRLDGLIADVVTRRLKVNRDARGILVETLRIDWPEVYTGDERPFAQAYYSLTNPGVARDEDRWHYHHFQEDRFVVACGDVVLALYDWRPTSPTYRRLNLIPLGEGCGDDGQLLVVVPRNVLHAFLVVGDRPALLLNSPTQLYNPEDEGRIPFAEAGACFSDATPFTWDAVRAAWAAGNQAASSAASRGSTGP
ncbi:MAG: dTDP-4-dehydrorhamnose 3,5-epimerase family protein [Chloroflexi bacterium]|nr:dTDP-4-dehydrorhamnose 3,5-epimerase family protein [Chloroflexota bacterium]